MYKILVFVLLSHIAFGQNRMFQSQNGNVTAVPIANNQAVIFNGLELWLDASNTASYPGTGTTWTDLSGNGNNGTLIYGVTYSSTNGGTMVFNGSSNNRVRTNFAPTFTDFTVCIWFKDNGSPQYGRLIDKDFVNGFWLGRNSNTPHSWGGGIKEAGNPMGYI
jgi:hypothetical protein